MSALGARLCVVTPHVASSEVSNNVLTPHRAPWRSLRPRLRQRSEALGRSWMHPARRIGVDRCSRCSCRKRRRPRRRPVDPAQNLGEQCPRHGDLGQLERQVAAVADDPRTDLDQLLAQRACPARLEAACQPSLSLMPKGNQIEIVKHGKASVAPRATSRIQHQKRVSVQCFLANRRSR